MKKRGRKKSRKIIKPDLPGSLNQTYFWKDLFLIAFTILFSLTFFYLDPSITGFSIALTNGTDLNNTNAVYFNITFNNSGFIQLNNSALFGFGSTGQNFSIQGNYTSKIFDANGSHNWTNFSWGELIPFGEELVSNPVSGSEFIEQTTATRGFNMTGLVLLMHFNNLSGDESYSSTNGSVIDYSGNNNVGNATQGIQTAYRSNEGKFNGAFEFDGINDVIIVPDSSSLNISNNMSISFWMKAPPNSPAFVRPISKNTQAGENSGWEFQRSELTGQLHLRFDTSGGNNQVKLIANEVFNNTWHHIVAVAGDGTARGYKDSVLIATSIYLQGNGFASNTSGINLTFGSQSDSGSFFNGTIDEVAIWNRSLTAQEIQDLYLRGHSNLTAQVRSCDDSSCLGETFRGPDNTTNSYFTNSTFNLLNNSITGNNQYFQYAILFERDINNSNFTPELYNFTLSFNNTISNITSINISSNGPTNKTNETLVGQFNYDDLDNDIQTLNETRWYNNSVEVTAFKNFTNVTSPNMTAGDNWIFSVRVFDGYDWSDWYNSSGHSVQNNAAPVFSGTINDQSWSEDTQLLNAFDLNNYFSDPENDAMNFTPIGNKVINVSISNGLVSFSQVSDFFGTDYVVFEANDSNLTRRSNNVTLTVNSVGEPPLVSQEGGGTSKTNAAIGIVAPAPKTIFLKDRIIVPLTIRNMGNVIFQGIKLTATSPESKIRTTIETPYIPFLGTNAEHFTNLIILTDFEKEKESVEIIVTAEISSPSLTDSTKIFLNAIEFGAGNKSVIIPRLQYAKDLFSKNTECSQLNQIISQAENLMKQEQFNEAQSLVEKAISGCTDIVLLDPKKLEISRETKLTKNLILAGEMIVFLVLLSVFLVYYKKRRSNYLRE